MKWNSAWQPIRTHGGPSLDSRVDPTRRNNALEIDAHSQDKNSIGSVATILTVSHSFSVLTWGTMGKLLRQPYFLINLRPPEPFS